MADTTPTLRAAAQRLLNAIEAVHEAEKSEGHARGGFVRTAPTRAHQRRVAEAWHENAAAVQALRAALAEQDAEQAEPPLPEYGATDFGFTFAGIELEDGDKRLMRMLVMALGTDHPAIDDMVALLFRARKPAPAAEQAELPRGLRPGEPPPPPGVQVPQCDVCVGCREWGGNGLWHHAGCTRIPAEHPVAWLEPAPPAPAAEQAEPVAWPFRCGQRKLVRRGHAQGLLREMAAWMRRDGVGDCEAVELVSAYIDAIEAATPAPAAAEQAEPVAPQKYDDTLMPFLHLMRTELHANAAKGDRPGWLSMDRNTALLEIYWHTAKLSAAVKNNNHALIAEHSADVANMAMMLADVCGVLPEYAPPAPARQEWQPIETAPTGTEVLIGAWIDGEFKWGRSVRFYDSGNEREGEPACGWVWSIDDCSDSVAENPTHWQPLPAAPITAAPAEGGAAAKPAPTSAVEDELSSACIECGGSGMRDSGGFYPWGEAALEPCDCEQAAPAEGGA